MRKGILFALLFLIQFACAHADSTTTYSSNTVRYVSLADWQKDTFQFHQIDTSEYGVQNFNPLAKKNIPFIYLGNLGTAYRPMFFNEEYQLGFDEGRHAFDAYLTTIDDIKFYRTNSPYTNLYYVWNRRLEQVFHFSFSQNIGPRLNYTVNFKRLASLGNYQRQKSDHLNYDVAIWYASKNRRYRMATAFISNSITVYENGGITNDSIFNVPSSLSTEFEPVALNNARNKIARRDIYLKQSYGFGKVEILKFDSTTLERVQTKRRIFHDINYGIRDYRYDENPLDSGVYKNIFLDSVNTADRMYVKRLTNRLGFEYFGNNGNSVAGIERIAFIIRHQLVDYQNLTIDTNLNKWNLISEINFQLFNKIYFNAEVGKVVSADYKGNYYIRAQAKSLLVDQKLDLRIRLFSGISTPAFTTTEYRSNHYQWDYKFKKTTSTNVHLDLNYLPSKIYSNIGYAMVSNHVYYDSSGTPKQYNGKVSIISLAISKNLNYKKWHFDNILNLQKSSNEDIIRQPLLHIYNSSYFESFLIKKAIFLRTGFDTRFYTSYIGYSYDPATMQFFNAKNKKFGDYAIVDFFISAKVKRAVLLFKLENIGNQIFRDGEFMVNNYPIPGRSFKIGFSWNFYD